MPNRRTELQQEVVEALIASKAVNFDAIGKVLAKYGDRAARAGEGFAVIIHRRVIDACIPPEPYLPGLNIGRVAETQVTEGG